MDNVASQSRWPWLILTAMAALVTLRIAGPSDLYDNDQPGPVAHIVDVAVNDQWLMQRQPSGKLATKPPMYPWLGAIAVKATGVTNEFVFKLPILIAFVMTTVVVLDLGRRSLGMEGGWLAAGAWACNFHVFKLLYTARTDMLVAMWAAIGLWCVMWLREEWHDHGNMNPHPGPLPEGERARASVRATACVAALWLSIAACALTKGPPAILPILFLLVMVTIDRAWRRCHPWLHAAGAAIAVALVLAWLVPALRAHPQWLTNIRTEVSDRITGINAPRSRDTWAIAMPGYFVARFAPWSVLTTLAAIPIVVAWRQRRRHPIDWALLWTLIVLLVFTIPKGRRADYLAPAYPAAAVLAAWVILQAVRHAGALRVVTHLALGATLLGAMAIVTLKPARAGDAVVSALAIAAFLVALIGLWRLHRRRYDQAAALACLALACGLGVYQLAMSGAAKDATPRELATVIAKAQRQSAAHGWPIASYQVGYTPVQALLGRNDPMDDRALEPVRRGAGGVLIVGKRVWEATATDLMPRSRVLHVTRPLSESDVQLMVVAVEPR